MTITDVSLSNQALAKIGTRTTITSLNPLVDDSAEAEQCALIFENTRKQALAAAYWNFARKTNNLVLNKQAPGTPGYSGISAASIWRPTNNWPPPNWLYEYLKPSDCVTARYVIPQNQSSMGVPIFGTQSFPAMAIGPPTKFTIQSGTNYSDSASAVTTVCTNGQDALLIYTRDHLDYSLWPPNFEATMIWAMAGNLAIALTGDKTLAKMVFAKANEIITQARLTDGNEGFTVQDVTPDWLVARGYGQSCSYPYDAPNYGPMFEVN